MRDPVVCADGHSYDRMNIERWLQSNNLSPITGLALTNMALTANHTLRKSIEEWIEQETPRLVSDAKRQLQITDAEQRAEEAERRLAERQATEQHEAGQAAECLGGCGFFGNANFGGMCSKCFREKLSGVKSPRTKALNELAMEIVQKDIAIPKTSYPPSAQLSGPGGDARARIRQVALQLNEQLVTAGYGDQEIKDNVLGRTLQGDWAQAIQYAEKLAAEDGRRATAALPAAPTTTIAHQRATSVAAASRSRNGSQHKQEEHGVGMMGGL